LRKLLPLIAAGFAVRAIYSWYFPQWGPGGAVPDINHYVGLAQGLLARGELAFNPGQPTAIREPGYPLFLSILFGAAGPSYRLGQLANCVLGALTLPLIMSVGTQVFGKPAGKTAAWVAAFYPQFVFYAATLDREILVVFLLVGATWLLLDSLKETRRLALAGLAHAACALTNCALLPYGLGGVPLVLWWAGRRAKGTWRRIGWYLAGFMALWIWWPARNWIQLKAWAPGTTAGFEHLYVSFVVPNDAAGTPEEAKFVTSDPVIAAAQALPEVEKDHYYARAAKSWIMEHPGAFAANTARSFAKLWRLYPYQRNYPHGYWLIFWASLLSDGWIIPLALGGILLAGRKRPETDFLLVMIASVSAVFAVFWSIISYRLPVMPFVIMFAARALAHRRRPA
jgi:4-amino-4-deoxy-L-arabinose transferase-like glycosyltransferase